MQALVGANTVVFLLWQRASLRAQEQKVDSYLWMQQNFTSSYQTSIKEGRMHTLLTAAFSHRSLGHFAFNMIGVWSFTPALVAMMGARKFLGLYLGGAMVSTLSSALYQHSRDQDRSRSLGAVSI
jgi:membrane associated rhomboid family serine protease